MKLSLLETETSDAMKKIVEEVSSRKEALGQFESLRVEEHENISDLRQLYNQLEL